MTKMICVKHFIVFMFINVITGVLTDYPMKQYDDAAFDLNHNSEIVQYRLPNHTHPETYDLSLRTRIDLGEFEYQGTVKIGIVVDEPTRQIVLHKSHLTVLNVKLTRMSGPEPVEVPLLPYIFNGVTELLTILTNGITFYSGEHLILEISFTNSIAIGGGIGFFSYSFKDSTGIKTWLAATHFEPNHARKAFPCYDEPSLKAKFTIRITHGERYNAIANMPETRIQNLDGTATTIFAETPLFPTYLVAFAISNLSFKENSNKLNTLRQRVFAQSSLIESSELAVRDGERLLSSITDYVGVNYSLPKIDQIAMPGYGPWCIENWGLVTYGQDVLLWNQTIHLLKRKLKIVRVMSHELSHQWFGNLVTASWWNFLWLNEGFASLFEYLATDLIYPEWNIFHLFVTQELQNVLVVDAKNSTRPMSPKYEGQSSSDIAKFFDKISYTKAACVLRMFLHAFSEKSFKLGLHYFLKEQAFKSVKEDHFFNALDKAVRQHHTLNREFSVHAILSSWTHQSGYPIITVARDYERNTITLKQERYISPPVQSNDKSTWWIPFNYATAKYSDFNQTLPDGWILPTETEKTIQINISNDDWIIFNKQQTGYYRVLYDETNYKLIAKQLNSENYTVIHVLNRAQILNDLNEFENVGLITFDQLIDLLSYLRRETEYAPWEAARKLLLRLKTQLVGHSNFNHFCSFVKHLVQPTLDTLGFAEKSNESILQTQLRSIIVDLACQFGIDSCLRFTHNNFVKAMSIEHITSPNDRVIMLENGARSASSEEIALLWWRFVNSHNSEEHELYASSIGHTKHIHLLEEYLNHTLKEYSDEIKSIGTWRSSLFRSVAQNGEEGLRLCLQMLKKHAVSVKRLYSYRRFNEFVLELSPLIVNENELQQFDDLLHDLETRKLLDEASAKDGRAQARNNIKWIKRRQEQAENYLLRSASGVSKVSLILLVLTSLLAFHF